MMMVDKDDKHGKRDKQMQRGISLLVAAVFLIIVVLAIWQHTQHEKSSHLRKHGEHANKLGHKGSKKSIFENKGLGKVFSHSQHHDSSKRTSTGRAIPHHHHVTTADIAKEALGRKLNRHDTVKNAEERFKAEHLERHRGAAGEALAFDQEGLQQRLKEKLHHADAKKGMNLEDGLD
jgi:hypothetical protein